MAFDTLDEYTDRIKLLANDVDGVRYGAEAYVQAVNVGVLEAFRIRPDFYREGEDAVPSFTVEAPDADIDFPKQYAMHLIVFCVGWLELIDSEGNEDQRAAALISSFQAKLGGR